MIRPTSPAGETLLGWASPAARDTLLDLEQPLLDAAGRDEEAVRTSLALVLYDPRQATSLDDDPLFSRCVIEERPVTPRRRCSRSAWIAAGAGVITIAAVAAAVLLGHSGAIARGPESGSPADQAVAPVPAGPGSRSAVQPRALPAPEPRPLAEQPRRPRRPRRSSALEVRIDREGVAEIWLRQDR